MKAPHTPYSLFEWTINGTIVAPDELFIAGAARGPRKQGERKVVQGREAWQLHEGGRLITDHRAAWLVTGGLRPGSQYKLLWIESAAHGMIDEHPSIRNWLRAEAMMMRAYAEQGADVIEGLVQIELALEFVPRSRSPSYGAPRRSARH